MHHNKHFITDLTNTIRQINAKIDSTLMMACIVDFEKCKHHPLSKNFTALHPELADKTLGDLISLANNKNYELLEKYKSALRSDENSLPEFNFENDCIENPYTEHLSTAIDEYLKDSLLGNTGEVVSKIIEL
jgi:hypothetical protein